MLFFKVFFTSLQMIVCAVDVSGVLKFYVNDCPFAGGIFFSQPAGTKPRTSHHRSPGGEMR